MRRDRDRIAELTSGFSEKRGETLVDDLQILLGDLCKRFGFCSVLADDVLSYGEPLTAEGFARAVITLEGFPEPDLEYGWNDTFQKIFTHRYGLVVTSADYVGALGHEKPLYPKR